MEDLQKQITKDHNIIIRSYKDNTIDDIPELLKKIDKITSQKEDSTIQLLNTDYICGNRHISQAISQAFKAFNEKQNFAKDRGLEICVRLSAQKQISNAIKTLGIKEKGNITAVYIDVDDEQIIEVEKLLSKRNDDLLESYDEDEIIRTYDLHSNDNIVDQLNEKIALLSLKN